MPETIDQEIHTLQSIFWSERDPDGLAFASLADAFRRKGEVREALDLLTDGMSRHPDFATGHVVATRLYVDQGMHSEAELAARRVLELDPENLVALSALVSVLSERGERGEAARHKTALFAADPDSDEARAVADIDVDAAGVEEVPQGDVVAEPAEQEVAGLEITDEWAADPDGAETPLERVADETGDEPLDITELAPETMYREGDTQSEEELAQAMDALSLEDEEPEIEGLPGLDRELPDLEALESAEDAGLTEQAGELAADPLGLANLSVDHGEVGGPDDEEPVDLASLAPDDEADRADEEVVDLASLAPADAAAEPDEDVVDLASLAPDEPAQEVVDLASLAPDEAADEVADVAALAPDDGADGTDEGLVELAALAPEEPDDEEPVELAALAPDEASDDVADVATLAPDDEPEQDVVDLASLAPEASVEELAEEMELAAAREAASKDDDGDSTDPVYTRTLADLYIKQGFHDKALEVLKRIQDREPDATDLAERIQALEEGDVPESGFGSESGSTGGAPDSGARLQEPGEPGPEDAPPPPTTASSADDAAGRAEDDLERRARELAEPDDHDHEMDSPFSWDGGDDQPDDAGEDAGIGSYLEGLLEWERRSRS